MALSDQGKSVVETSSLNSDSGAGSSLDEDECITSCRSYCECYFRESDAQNLERNMSPHEKHYRKPRSCYSHHRKGGCCLTPLKMYNKPGESNCDIHRHLQSMFALLRPEQTLKMAVRLESVHELRTRYLVVVGYSRNRQSEECCLLGIDCNERTTVGLVLKVLADTTITLDGDGGFSVSTCGHHHIFKPVSVQAMWSALQSLHRVSTTARERNYFDGGDSHEWVSYYQRKIESDRSCLNEWHAMNDLVSKRPPSPDSLRTKPRERLETEQIIRSTLKEIMMSVDLDRVTSKYIRTRLEVQLDVDLGEFKSFIDEEMLVILGQMDHASQIFPHLYLGSEWNASNLEELNKHGVSCILNVTREIDNFFPGIFDYLNVRVYDDENTNLLKHWDKTYKYINEAKKDGYKVLVHCKMGVSRSASVVIAYAMKAYNWSLQKAMDYVKTKRTCIKPNSNFIAQLETYQGILDAMKNKEKLQRSRSETNLNNGSNVAKNMCKRSRVKSVRESMAIFPLSKNYTNFSARYDISSSGSELASLCSRPKSWSPENSPSKILSSNPGGTSQSLEYLTVKKKCESESDSAPCSLTESITNHIPPAPPLPPPADMTRYYNQNVRMPCSNGLAYSVSQNRIVQLYSAQNGKKKACVKSRVIELELSSDSNNASKDKKPFLPIDIGRMVLNLTSQFECGGNISPNNEANMPPTPSSTTDQTDGNAFTCRERNTNITQKSLATCHPQSKNDVFSNQLDRVFEKEEYYPVVNNKYREGDSVSRQSSWSSYDSAVILNYSRDRGSFISRQSSWGSADTRSNLSIRNAPSLSSSWGSYDMRQSSSKDDLEDGAKARSRDKCETSVLVGNMRDNPSDGQAASTRKSGRLFASCCSLINDCNIKRFTSQPNIISPCWKNGRRNRTVSSKSDSSKDEPTRTQAAIGIVSNLKKEFESKILELKGQPEDANHSEGNHRSRLVAKDDLVVKKLVGKYEVEPTSTNVVVTDKQPPKAPAVTSYPSATDVGKPSFVRPRNFNNRHPAYKTV